MATSNRRWAARRKGQPSEYGGGSGENRVIPGRVPMERTLTSKELSRDMRREGIRHSAHPEPPASGTR